MYSDIPSVPIITSMTIGGRAGKYGHHTAPSDALLPGPINGVHMRFDGHGRRRGPDVERRGRLPGVNRGGVVAVGNRGLTAISGTLIDGAIVCMSFLSGLSE